MQQQDSLEQALQFTVGTKQLVGILHSSKKPSNGIAVLIVVGGPQTRVGSHRQFVLLSRFLANNGFASLRFDFAGMGDSQGNEMDFKNVSNDIEQAIALLKAHSGASKVVIWGLCDAASAALIYVKKKSTKDLAGLILLNPWVRSEQGEAKAIVKHYYLNRLKTKAFWLKLFSFKFNFLTSFSSLKSNVVKMSSKQAKSKGNTQAATTDENYIAHMLEGVTVLNAPILLIISGNDLTAAEFLDLVEDSKQWAQQVSKKASQQVTIPDANHTFSTQNWRREVEQATLAWLQDLNLAD